MSDLLLEKLPPQDLESEICVLGSLMKEPDLMGEMQAMLGADDFYRREHQLIFDAMIWLYKDRQTIDFVLLCKQLKEMGKLDEVGGDDYVVDCMNAVPSALNAPYYAEAVVRCRQQRQLIAAGQDLIKAAYAPKCEPEELASKTLGKLSVVVDRQGVADKISSLGEMTGQMIDALADDTDELVPPMVPSKFKRVNDLTAGYEAGELTVWGGDEGGGKSTRAYNEIMYIGEYLKAQGNNERALFVSYEVGRFKMSPMVAAMDTGIAFNKLIARPKKGNQILLLSDEDNEALIKYVERTGDWPIDFCTTYPDRTEIQSLLVRAQAKKTPYRVVVIDHLHIMPDDRNEPSKGHIETWIRLNINGLKKLGVKYETAMVVLCQFVDNRNKAVRPAINDLKGSSALKQAASNVLLLWTDPVYDDQPVVTTMAQWVKNRYGPKHVDVAYTWDKPGRRMTECV